MPSVVATLLCFESLHFAADYDVDGVMLKVDEMHPASAASLPCGPETLPSLLHFCCFLQTMMWMAWCSR